VLSAAVRTLVRWSQGERGVPEKLLALAAGTLLFLGLLPALLVWLGLTLRFPSPLLPPLAAAFVVAAGVLPGLSLLCWAALTQWRRGRGTPVPTAPPRRLVVAGPYRLCRNPIELGAILYYLGFGTLFASFGAGIFAALMALVFGSAYHRLVEERELSLRFGDEYRRYRERTPFLIPSLTTWLDRHR
jgi:protein-S-isoprenylcysteine O-methyltransferase Ste14